MTRLTPLRQDELTPEQQRLQRSIIGGKRGDGRELQGFLDAAGAMRGPFNAMLHAPAPGATLQRLGEQLRFEGTLSDRCRELAILAVARHFRARYEWWAHARIALGAGLPASVISAIAENAPPQFDDATEAQVFAFARELVETGSSSDACYGQTLAVLGEPALVELVVLLGYYSTISMLLNAFAVDLPPGASTPFDEPS